VAPQAGQYQYKQLILEEKILKNDENRMFFAAACVHLVCLLLAI
jgi:hypothetical protein